MKSFKNQAAQGDVLFRRIDALPKDATPVEIPKGQGAIVAHSETGHHHSFNPGDNVFLYSSKDELVSYLEVKEPATLMHRRDFDTHEPMRFDAGFFEIRRQREQAPEGWRKVMD